MSQFSRVCEKIDEASNYIYQISATISKRNIVDVIGELCLSEMKFMEFHMHVFQDTRQDLLILILSLAIKTLDLFLVDQAKDFLNLVLGKSINHIIKQDLDCELDPYKIDKKKEAPHISEKIRSIEGVF